MGFFKNLFGSNGDAAKAASPAGRGATKAATPAKGNDAKQTASKPQTAHKSTAGQGGTTKQNAVELPPGYDAAWRADQAWDKHRRAEAVRLYEQAIAEGFQNGDIHFYHLGSYYMERKDWKNLRRIIGLCPDYVLDQNWAVQAQQLLDVHLPVLPNDWEPAADGKTANDSGSSETWLEQYERLTSALPQFDFDMGDAESKMREEDVEALNSFTLSIRRKLMAAQDCINNGERKAAATILVEFVRNGYWKTEPYNLLLQLYHEAGQTEDEKRLAGHAARHFRLIQIDQKRSVLSYAKLAGCVGLAKSTMDKGKRIFYFDGLFEVYNPYPEIEEWQRLAGG